MLPFDVHKRARIRLECWITIDVRDDTDLSVGAFLDETTHRSGVFGPPIDRQSGSIEALQLRQVILGANDAFDGSSMGISEGVAMVGSKQVMSNSLVVETIHRKPMPHPLTVSCFEVVWSPITPHVDAIEVIVELLVVEEGEPYGKDKVIVILIGFLAVAEEVEILSHAMTIAHIFQHDDAILHDGVVVCMSDFRSEEG